MAAATSERSAQKPALPTWATNLQHDVDEGFSQMVEHIGPITKIAFVARIYSHAGAATTPTKEIIVQRDFSYPEPTLTTLQRKSFRQFVRERMIQPAQHPRLCHLRFALVLQGVSKPNFVMEWPIDLGPSAGCGQPHGTIKEIVFDPFDDRGIELFDLDKQEPGSAPSATLSIDEMLEHLAKAKQQAQKS